MKEITAEQTRLSFDRGEIRVDFGQASEPDTAGTVTVELSNRVVLTPSTAQRLLMALAETLQGHRTGAPAEPPPVTRAPGGAPSSAPGRAKPALTELLDPTSDMDSSRAAKSAAAESSSRVLGIVAGFGVPYVNERSIRLRQKTLLSNRFLLTVGRKSIEAQAKRAAATGGDGDLLPNALGQLGMPPEFLDAAIENMPRAQALHFGFEADEDRHLLKVYLEMKQEGTAPAVAGPLLHYVAYKWDPADPEQRVVSRYMLHDGISVEQIRARLQAIYADGDSDGGDSGRIALDVLALGASRMAARDMNYMEIEEEGNARRSFDLNLYDAGLLVRDLQPFLARMRDRYEIAPGRFQVLYDQIKARRFGHLAGGVHRDGGDFFNVYFGAQMFEEGLWRDAFSAGQIE